MTVSDLKSIRRRRRRALAEATGLPEDAVAELEALAPRCEWANHDTGEYDCEPGAPAEYVVRLRQHCERSEFLPVPSVVLLICLKQQIRLRSRQHETRTCGCGASVPHGTLIDFLGPIEEYYP